MLFHYKDSFNKIALWGPYVLMVHISYTYMRDYLPPLYCFEMQVLAECD